MNELSKKKIAYDYIPMMLTAIGITVSLVFFKQVWFKVLPLYFSLGIVLLNARANRIGFLLGGTNALIYIVGYIYERLYGMATSTLFDAGIQFLTYFCWRKNAYKKATKFRVLNKTWRLLLIAGIALAWGTAALVLYQSGGNQFVLDGLTFVLGIIVPLMTMAGLMECLPLNVLSSIVSLSIWITSIASGNVANMTYLCSSTYGFYMVIRKVLKWNSLYKEQQKGIEKEETA